MVVTMTRIICDTMIWYGLADGTLKLPDESKYKLVCTYLSFTELTLSPNNFKQLSQVKRIMNKIFEIKPEFITETPMEFASNKVENKLPVEFDVEDDFIFMYSKQLFHYDEENLKDDVLKEHLEFIVRRRKENFEDHSEFLNDFYKKDGLKVLFKKYLSIEDEVEMSQKLFANELSNYNEKIYSYKDIKSYLFEFYINIRGRYTRNLMTSGMKSNSNDHNDLINMIYVQPKDKYWTLEKRWLSIAKETNMNKYLFTQSAE